MELKNTVIERFERMLNYVHKSDCGLVHILTIDAENILELLKEQEAVKPKWVKGYAYCDQCGYKLHWIVDRNNFCPNCGRAVKWE